MKTMAAAPASESDVTDVGFTLVRNERGEAEVWSCTVATGCLTYSMHTMKSQLVPMKLQLLDRARYIGTKYRYSGEIPISIPVRLAIPVYSLSGYVCS